VANVPPQGGRKHPHQDFIQIDTTNILFICGGAFDGLDKIVAKRASTKGGIGFGAVRENATRESDVSGLLHQVISDDLLQFGLIPEFVGRMPVVVNVDALTEDDLVRILTEPKNALVRQYQKLFRVDHVALEFTEEALRATAREALRTHMGARGLRTILEETLLDVMYDIPSHPDITRWTVDADAIRDRRSASKPVSEAA